jgi:type II secretory pathway pseudopilin PulG
MTRRIYKSRGQREGGFALLLVFLMAAIIGITLYIELPRIAFEAQRQKEQLLMERGQQYQIAIRRYLQKGLKNGMNQGPPPTWPGKIEDLENTNGRRFLRRRYIDPMTGKDEWRFIHIQNGVLTDSVNNPNNQQQQQQQSVAGRGIDEFAGLGGTNPNGGASGGANAVLNRRRPSDNNPAGPGGTGDPSNPNPGGGVPPGGPTGLPGGVQGPAPGVPPQFGPVGPSVNVPGMPSSGQPGGMPINPALPRGPNQSNNPNNNNPGNSNSGWNTSGMGGFSSPNAPNSPGATGGQPIYPGQVPPGFGQPVNSNNGGVANPYVPGSPGGPNFPQPGTNTGANPPQQNVQGLINGILTNPRPGGMPVASGPLGTTTIGGGIVGVASNLDADSIMVCADHTNYKEWEFLFDVSKWAAPKNPNVTALGTPAGQNSPSTAGNSFGGGGSSGSGGSGGSSGSGPGNNGPSGALPGNRPGVGNTGGGVTPFMGPGPAGVGGNNNRPPGQNGQGGPGGQNGMPGMQGNFGSVCGMEARPGHQ